MLRSPRSVVFSKRAVLRTSVRAQHAGRYQRELRSRWERCAIRRRRDPVRAHKARGERADAAQPDCEADRDNGAVGRAKQGSGTLQPSCQQVRMRRLAEGTPELTAEVRARKTRRPRQIGDAERLRVAGIDQIPGPQQMTLR